MKELDFLSIISVFHEMLGGWLWVLLALIIFGTFAFIALLLFERRIKSNRMVWSQAGGLFGGILAEIIMVNVSSSGFTDAGGPADWFLIALVFGLGFIGAMIIIYTTVGWIEALSSKPKSLSKAQ